MKKAQGMRLLARHEDLGREVWIRWSDIEEAYEMFTCEGGRNCIGIAETEKEAREAARDYFNELMA